MRAADTRPDGALAAADSRLAAALKALRDGRMIVVTDDEDRENEGDLIALATDITTETVAFMARFGRGLICQPITEERAKALELPLMVAANEESHRTAFTVSVDAAVGITTGISAADRARTIRTVMDADAGPKDLVRPGHVFPLIAREGGVHERPGHTEAAVDLARLAGSAPGAVICEILGDNGLALTGEALAAFCRHHNLVSLTIQELIRSTACHSF
jgi:3,4-dihydroxy 2-butanone 4-phosphate synthase/GTP cyclohydrolase II